MVRIRREFKDVDKARDRYGIDVLTRFVTECVDKECCRGC